MRALKKRIQREIRKWREGPGEYTFYGAGTRNGLEMALTFIKQRLASEKRERSQ